MNKITKITYAILAFALIGYVLLFFMLSPPIAVDSKLPIFQWSLANSFLYTSLHVGAAILFLIGLNAYKAQLRVAYMSIAIGIVLVGLGLAQVVLLQIFGLIGSPWVVYGGVMIPFVAAGLAIYLGARSRAKLVNITSPLTKLAVALPILVICILLVSFLPHASSSLSEVFFDVSNAISVWDVVFYALSLGLVIQIKNRGGEHYASSMIWLMIGLIGSVVISLTLLLGSLITGKTLAGYPLDTLVIIGGFLYLKAGHSFARTEEL